MQIIETSKRVFFVFDKMKNYVQIYHYVCMYHFHVRVVSLLKHPFEGDDGRRLNTIWYFGPHFWAKNVRDFLGDELQ